MDRRRTLFAVLASALVACAASAEETHYNRVNFGVESAREVQNDWATAVVGVTHEDTDPARLADRINTDVQWGLSLAKGVAAVKVRTGGYRTHPVGDPQNRLRRWRGGQDLVLEGSDPKQLSELLGRLQERLQLTSLHFSVSPERRRAIEDELVDEALAAFRARAGRVQAKLGAKGYELVDLHIDTSGGGSPPMPMMRMAMAESAAAPPALEGGTSNLVVRVQGSVELEF